MKRMPKVSRVKVHIGHLDWMIYPRHPRYQRSKVLDGGGAIRSAFESTSLNWVPDSESVVTSSAEFRSEIGFGEVASAGWSRHSGVALDTAGAADFGVPIDLDAVFTRGGEELIALLDYSVRAVHCDVLFEFLVREYQQQPTGLKAVALYDGFCAPPAPARLSVPDVLPPQATQLEGALRPFQANVRQAEAARSNGTLVPPPLLPPGYLFDSVAAQVRQRSVAWEAVSRLYNPALSPIKNLPEGRMNAGQRHFVEKVWEPKLRPYLVSAGFRRVMSIG